MLPEKENKNENIENILEAKENLVNAFVWLIEQDKKQNPDLYQSKKD